MCGLVGCFDTHNQHRIDPEVIQRMTASLTHRGPDSDGYCIDEHAGLGFRRLSIIDLNCGDQPLYNEDRSIVLLCNGEIYNYRELRREMQQKGHVFYTNSDVEVLAHLYEEYGPELLHRLNGQFAFVIYDRRKQQLLLARDHFGVNPLYYAVRNGVFIFASEIKAILEHPDVPREVNLTGLDQIISFPGLISPATMFKGVQSLENGHFLVVKSGGIHKQEYWDLDYPKLGELEYHRPEQYYVDRLHELLVESIRYRLQADVPIGLYLSGGLDSSLVAMIVEKLYPDTRRHTFSVNFADKGRSEAPYQRMIADSTKAMHHEIVFDTSDVIHRLKQIIYHTECPVKETYDTCAWELSRTVREQGVKVVLAGQGADELFAGYVGYRFDQFHTRRPESRTLAMMVEEELREQLWGDKDLFYEKEYAAFREVKTALYSDAVNELFHEIDCLNVPLIDREKVRGRHYIHQRSYLDFKLRMVDHLLTDHGDKMALANSVEARYPFLDINLIDFSREIPPELKVKNLSEKYILKRIAEHYLPKQIIQREKFGWHAPGSPELLQQGSDWVHDLLSYDRIKRQGYFNPDTIEFLKHKYAEPGFRLNQPFEDDLLIIVLTFNIFLDLFSLPELG
jgi:asparagine synthase (glutamine-hydrolysing)